MTAACVRQPLRALVLRAATALVLPIASSGCAVHARALAPSMGRDTLWYASARARVHGEDSRAVADALEYGAAVYDRTDARDAFTSPIRLVLRDTVRFTREAFLSALAARVSDQRETDRFAVLYVHGFGTGLGECWTNPLQARIRSGSNVPWIAFCWPSHGSGITWPTAGSLFARAYTDDVASAFASDAHFRTVLDELTGALGASRIVLTAHSLGARLVSESLASNTVSQVSSEIDASQALSHRMRALALLAPDVDASRFADTLLPRLQSWTSRIVLYSSRRDRALTIARRLQGSPRAGLAEPTPVLRTGLETVDVTDALNADGWWQRHFGNRHSIRRASGTVWDLMHVVGRELAPSCRAELGYAVVQPDGSWRLLAGQRPDSTRLATCAHRAQAVESLTSTRRAPP